MTFLNHSRVRVTEDYAKAKAGDIGKVQSSWLANDIRQYEVELPRPLGSSRKNVVTLPERVLALVAEEART